MLVTRLRWVLAAVVLVALVRTLHGADLPRHVLEIEALTAPEASLKRIEQELILARERGDRREAALLELARANACRVLADWACQRDAGNEASLVARTLGDRVLQARGLIAAARGSIAMQDHARGNQLLDEARQLSEALGEPALIGDVYLGYSSLSHHVGKFRSALEHAERGLALLPTDRHFDLRARLLRNKARAQIQLGNLTQARENLAAGLAAADLVGDPKLIAEMALEQARAARLDRDIEAQEIAGRRILTLGEQLANTQLRGLGFEVLGLAALDAGRRAQALDALETARQSFEQLKLERDELRVVRELLGMHLATPVDTARSTRWLRRALVLFDSVMVRDRAQAADDYEARIRLLEKGFEVERLSQQAALNQTRADYLAAQNRLMYSVLIVGVLVGALLGYLLMLLGRSNRKLAAATAEARALAEAKTQFLARMSHEIRSPLTAILGYGERALRRGKDPEALRAALVTTQSAGQHLLSIVNDVLDAAQIDAGQLRIRPEAVDPVALAHLVFDMLSVGVEGRPIELKLSVEGELPERIQTDPLRLRQILLNLLGNAIKFTERGHVTLRLRGDRVRERVVFEVEDSGVGLSAEQIGRLFRPYAQADGDTQRRFGGTGLGLYISRQLADRLGGQLGVESEPGRGSRFRLELPAGLAVSWRVPDAHAGSVRALPDRTEDAPLDGRVILAEDDPVLRELLVGMITDVGARVTAVGNGRELLERVAQEPCDLILVDMHMPEMDGRTAVRTLRERGEQRPILALTADALTSSVAEYERIGCQGVLTKPITHEQLRRALRQYLRPKSAGPPNAEAMNAILGQARKRFAARARTEAETLAAVWQERDLSRLGMLLHRLKGTSGFLELRELYRAVVQAENDLRASALGGFEGDLEAVRTALLDIAATAEAASPAAA